ncbi:MAG: hypothetical protein HY092_03015 [Candidatus Kerfeldbacteria bacterium]|nr:hypothetical protein [Candidatus Kerfeldbacteria bacterium]
MKKTLVAIILGITVMLTFAPAVFASADDGSVTWGQLKCQYCDCCKPIHG